MLRCAYEKIRNAGFSGVFSESMEVHESSLDEFLCHINEGRVPTNYFAYEGLRKIPQSNLKLMLVICVLCHDYLGWKWGYPET